MTVRHRTSKKLKNGYVFEVYIPYKENGISKTYTKSGFLTKKEALEHEALKRAELQTSGTIKKECTLTLNEVFDEFMLVGSSEYQSNTMYNTKQDHHYFKDSLGKMLITKINYTTLQNFFNERQDVGIESNKNIKKALGRIFKHAMRSGYITQNPLELVKVKGITKTKEKQVLEYKDLLLLTDELENSNKFIYHAYSIAIKISYFTGLRVSEVLALNKRDFDIENNLINIDKKLVYRGLKKENYYATNEMKSAKSKAVLPLADMLKEDVLKWFYANPYEKAVCDEEGYYLNPNCLGNVLKSIAERFGIHFNFHMLRHSFSTTLVMSNVNIKTVQELMRHSNFNTTLSLYTHVNEERKKEAINSVFNLKRVENVLSLNCTKS